MTTGVPTASPTVSVIVPVWNVEPYLAQSLDSVVEQTIGLDRIELITVDDGSTDGGGRMLDEYAARYPQVTVVHEANSGGAGRPRNVGLDRAGGTYVFFLDADDYLGPECLERLVAMAERNESDIVLGKLVGIEGRRVYRQAGAFRKNEDRVDVERVYRSGNVLKLFRRSFVERVGARFPEGVAGGEDGDFMARLYLEASTISVVADYECYFVRKRTRTTADPPDRRDDRVSFFQRLEEERIKPVAAQRKPGLQRDMLMLRHLRKMLRKFSPGWLALEPAERRRVFDTAAGILERWHTGLIGRALPAWAAIRAWCLQHGLLEELEHVVACPPETAYGDPLVEGRRMYARFPHFRDASGIPDRCFDITREIVPEHTLGRATLVDGRLEISGQAYLTLIGGDTTVELRRWPRGETVRFEAASLPTPELRDKARQYPMAGYHAAIDLATAADGKPLRDGSWGVHLSIGNPTVRRSVPVRIPRRGRQAVLAGPRPTRGAGLRTSAAGALRLRVGRRTLGDRILERAERAYVGVSRRLGRALAASRAGRLVEMAIERVRPGMVAQVDDD
jgi:glycosyltransferase involved in cell wall biosynthesis